MEFSIVTPSFRQLSWLKRCARSVADQEGVQVEHHIQDGGSEPGLEQWVRENSDARLVSEPDTGMYDAINKALAATSGEICGILNCDEQYLPGTLRSVAEMFAKNPSADLVAGDCLIVDPRQELIAFRKVTPLRPAMILTDHLYAFTCALFFRRKVWEQAGPFDTSFKSVADGEWVARALRHGHRAVLMHQYLAAFTWTGANLSGAAISREEDARVHRSTPLSWQVAAPLLRRWRHFERWWRGGYRSGPISYDVFVGEDDTRRTRLTCARPSFRFPGAS